MTDEWEYTYLKVNKEDVQSLLYGLTKSHHPKLSDRLLELLDILDDQKYNKIAGLEKQIALVKNVVGEDRNKEIGFPKNPETMIVTYKKLDDLEQELFDITG